jgi:hypothetical protein
LDNKPERTLLEQWWQKAIKEGLERVGYAGKLPVFELVYWADIVYPKPLDMEDPYFADDVYTRSPDVVDYHGSQIILTALLSKGLRKLWNVIQGTKASQHTSEWIDPLVKKYFTEVDIYLFNRDTAGRNRIRNRLLEVLYRYRNDDILVIGHSMGSVIAYDVLFTEAESFSINTLVTMGSPLGFYYIAEKLARAYDLPVTWPVRLPTPKSIEKRWFNFYDPADVIALRHNLMEVFTANARGVAPIDCRVVNDYMNRGERNPHNIFGYLRAKEFSKLLVTFIQEPEKYEVKKKWVRQVLEWFNPKLQ